MAPIFAEWMAGGFFPAAILAVSLFAAAASFWALCILCKRKDNNRMPIQDKESLDDAVTCVIEEADSPGFFSVPLGAAPYTVTSVSAAPTVLGGRDSTLPDALLKQVALSPLGRSVSNLPKLKRTNSRGKNQSPPGAGVSYEDDGTASSCSFVILPQRELPHPPSVNLLTAEETYSNLAFPKRAPEVFYEPVAVKDGEPEKPCEPPAIPEGASGGVQEDQAVEAAYARVWKGKHKTNRGGPAAGASQTPQEPHQGRIVLTPQAVQVHDMYSVVCKNRKKAAKNCKGPGEERTPPVEANQGNCRKVADDDQESVDNPGCWSSSLESLMIEPCYESINCGSWSQAGRKETTEPAYEIVDVHWEDSRRKEKSKKKAVPAENLYESIENVAFKCQNLNTASRFEL